MSSSPSESNPRVELNLVIMKIKLNFLFFPNSLHTLTIIFHITFYVKVKEKLENVKSFAMFLLPYAVIIY